jgi:hypothetical protein
MSPSQPFEQVDFYEASLPRMIGRGLVLPMLKYLKFGELMTRLRKQTEKDESPIDRVNTFLSVLDLVGLQGTEETALSILGEIAAMNPPTPPFAWQQIDQSRVKEAITIEHNTGYDGRELAQIVTTLAATFGWTADYILNTLTYYEACIYMQEALLLEHQRMQWSYMLADVGSEKVGETWVKKPLPDLPWMKSAPVRHTTAEKVPDKYKPSGYVVDYTLNPGGVVNEVARPEAESSGTYIAHNDVRGEDQGNSNPGQVP